MLSKSFGVPFNDLTRIHAPLLGQFQSELSRIIEESNLVLGEDVDAFERELASAEDCRYAIGVNSGTSAIELALRAFGIGHDDEVITTAFTFVATCFAILQTGATPVLVDINRFSGLMDTHLIEAAITKKTKAVVFVTIHGRVEGIEEVQELCKERNIRFIIDAAQSHLGTHNLKSQTNYCDAATLSFYPGKNLGALGEGGAILTNALEVSQSIKLMRDWGASEKYNHIVWGGNFRLESIQAAFLRIKLRELRKWTIERQQIADTYNQELNSDVLMNALEVGASHVYHIYAIHTQKRDEMSAALREASIGFGLHYPKAIHQQAAYSRKVRVASSLDNAEWLSNSTLSLPIFPGQKSWEVKQVIEVVNHFGMVN